MHHEEPKSRRASLRPRLDAIDRKILRHLVEDGRMSNLDVAERVGLSPTPCSRRIRQLEESGVIDGYSARINPAALGLKLCVVMFVKLSRYGPEGHEQFLEAIGKRPEITECLLVSGRSDYLLRVWVEDTDALREFTINALQGIPAVAETSTMLVLNQITYPLADLR
ncbi:Lrp/AsnC family transcriptional regulator [Labrys wisconsinensis]|uniref:Lrp/AsnC family leucine-responsive transcriptional regulator n=1 Tax=Labrys wisconsinensis TaxID=425677 RepID=A0ABU0JFM4_9HYPH|nr:Lrp/AsnC family transcriptional regulator [Labrys wisconsinensis]MDQ0471932.1 Lrp/AsnC family leucine-responsive transcriptional regulator [Labrys wisconsinensis]